MSSANFVDNAVDPKVRGFLHLPANPNNDGLVLSHGAGSSATAPLLVALAETFSANGYAVLRCDLPYRQSRSFGPPGPGDDARDRAGLRNSLAAVRKMVLRPPPPGRPFLWRTPVQHALRRLRNPRSSPPCCCSLIRCIPRANPNNSAPSIFPTCARPRSSSRHARSVRLDAEMERAMKMIPAKTKLLVMKVPATIWDSKARQEMKICWRQCLSNCRS